MFLVFMGYFLDVANGYPYMETKFGFLPEDLFEMAEGYVLSIGLDENGEVIGYKFVHLGKMMEQIRAGVNPGEAYEKNIKTYGRYDDAVKYIDPRNE